MILPSKKSAHRLIKSGGAICACIYAIARSLEALNEYNSEQAFLIAADTVRSSRRIVTERSSALVGPTIV